MDEYIYIYIYIYIYVLYIYIYIYTITHTIYHVMCNEELQTVLTLVYLTKTIKIKLQNIIIIHDRNT